MKGSTEHLRTRWEIELFFPYVMRLIPSHVSLRNVMKDSRAGAPMISFQSILISKEKLLSIFLKIQY